MRSECRCRTHHEHRPRRGRAPSVVALFKNISSRHRRRFPRLGFFFPSQCPPRSPATASPVPSSARSSLSPLARTPTDRTRRGGMFSALSLSQQLRTSIAAVSCFGGLSKEPPVSARKGSARRASGASVDDLFDRYAPELEPMTAPGTSPSQVRSHLPPEPTRARVRLASHPETQLAG